MRSLVSLVALPAAHLAAAACTPTTAAPPPAASPADLPVPSAFFTRRLQGG